MTDLSATIIIYADDDKHLDRSIDDILDKTPTFMIGQIIVCDDAKLGYHREGVQVIQCGGVGKAAAWDRAVELAAAPTVVFLSQCTKVTVGWLENLLAKVTDTAIAIPQIYSLDTNLWSLGELRWGCVAWRWDLRIYNKPQLSSASPGMTSCGFAINRQRYHQLSGFDVAMADGDGACLELAIRNWLHGGSVISTKSKIGAYAPIQFDSRSLLRTMELWFPEHLTKFYNSTGMDLKQDVGRLRDAPQPTVEQTTSADQFLQEHLPELLSVYNLFGTAHRQTVAVVCDGPSLDNIPRSLISRYDVVIGVDCGALVVDCDYAISYDLNIISLLHKKHQGKMLLPNMLDNRVSGQRIEPTETVPNCLQFELGRLYSTQNSLMPPFTNFGHAVHAAVHFALLLGPASVTLFGCDNKIIDGRSHTSLVDFYDGGRYWDDSENLRQRYATFELGLDALGKLAATNDIVLLRMNQI